MVLKDHLSALVLATVILVALGGIYILYQGPGQAIQEPVTVDTIGRCCCQADTLFTVPATVLSQDPGVELSCQQQCAFKKAVSLGTC